MKLNLKRILKLIKNSLGITLLMLVLGASVASATLTFTANQFTVDGALTINASTTMSIGTSETSGITIGRSGQTVSFPGFVSSSIIDASALMSIGTSTATNITIGRSGQTVSFPGNVSSTGILTIGSSSTFKGNLNATSTNADSVSVGTCGTSPTIIGGNGRGAVTTGSDASSTCTITFGLAFANKPLCQVTSETTSSIGYRITPSASTLVIITASSSAFISNTLDYFCWGQ